MEHNTALYLGMLGVVIAVCAIAIAYRLQKLGAQRADAEQRASIAFAELNRTTRELRRRKSDDPADDPALTPGERLRRMYPGLQRPTPIPSGERS